LRTLKCLTWSHCSHGRFKDQLIAALDREIASEADDAAALKDEARQQREAETMGDLLVVERDESWFVWLALAQCLPVEYRADCAPQAVFGCRLITTPATFGRRTSPEHIITFAGISDISANGLPCANGIEPHPWAFTEPAGKGEQASAVLRICNG
jgi:hypothetical protein